MKEIKISTEKVQGLLNFISELPFKYAKPLMDEFAAIIKEQVPLEQPKKELEDTGKTKNK